MAYKNPALRRTLRAERIYDLGGYLASTGKLLDVAKFVRNDAAPLVGMQRVDMTIESTGDHYRRDIETFTTNRTSTTPTTTTPTTTARPRLPTVAAPLSARPYD